MIDRSRHFQTSSMVKVLRSVRGPELTLGAWLLTAATVAACAGKAIDVGSEGPTATGGFSVGGSGATLSGGSGGSPPSEPDTPRWPSDSSCLTSAGTVRLGSWKGHWSAGGARDSEVLLQVTGSTAEGVPCGTVTIGNGPAPPPVIDAEAIYPPEPPPAAGGSSGGFRNPPAVGSPWPGYAYRMLDVKASASRLAFFINYQEILRPWCQLQQPVEGWSSCMPEVTSATTTSVPGQCSVQGPNVTEPIVPCFRLLYCSAETCLCQDGTCDASYYGQATQFELHWDGDALEGSVNSGLIFLDPVP